MEDLKSTVWFRTMRSSFLSTEVIKMALEEDNHCYFSLIQHSLDLVLAQWPGARVLGIESVKSEGWRYRLANMCLSGN